MADELEGITLYEIGASRNGGNTIYRIYKTETIDRLTLGAGEMTPVGVPLQLNNPSEGPGRNTRAIVQDYIRGVIEGNHREGFVELSDFREGSHIGYLSGCTARATLSLKSASELTEVTKKSLACQLFRLNLTPERLEEFS